MDINAWLGIGTFLVVIAGASFAFVNKFFLNPDYQYVEFVCIYTKTDKKNIKIEKRNGKVNQVFCSCNNRGDCDGIRGHNGIGWEEPPSKCWVYKN